MRLLWRFIHFVYCDELLTNAFPIHLQEYTTHNHVLVRTKHAHLQTKTKVFARKHMQTYL